MLITVAELRMMSTLAPGGFTPGNLVPAGGRVLSQSATEVRAFALPGEDADAE